MSVQNSLSISRRRVVVVSFLIFAFIGALWALYLSGCTKTVEGDVKANQKPVVYFANIPPDGQSFSRNPEVYWYGTDPDGLIVRYRYYIVTVDEIGTTPPEDFILTVPDSLWTYVDVDPKESDPKTKNIIPLIADQDNPTNRYVSQWVFLQAFDMEGLASDIVYRLFSRNDHAPDTRIYEFKTDTPFVNAVQEGGIVTGVRMRWLGLDPIDYPGEAPPFEFQWRLYGPYDDSTFEDLKSRFYKTVLLTTDGQVYQEGDTIIRCDTTYGDSMSVACDTIDVTEYISNPSPISWGSLEQKFLVDDPEFINDTALNKVADSSWDDEDNDVWVYKTSDTMWNVYWNDPDTVTQQKHFIFWVRSRDDAFVPDLVPAFADFTVINPRFERDVLVMDFTLRTSLTSSLPLDYSVPADYWKKVLKAWKPDIQYDDTTEIMTDYAPGITPDYIKAYQIGESVPLRLLLQHKILILYDDQINLGLLVKANRDANVYKAIDAGVNVWVTMRAPIVPNNEFEEWAVIPPEEYARYFGVQQLVYSAWNQHSVSLMFKLYYDANNTPEDERYLQPDISPDRIEDFIGAYSMHPESWPDLSVDTNRLHNMYMWVPYGFPPTFLQYATEAFGFMPEHPGLPEVGWSVRSNVTEVLYLYKSFYGSNHPLKGNYNMEGNPVAHRLETSLFRTVHFNFTPLALDTAQMQVVVDSVLNWLYPEDLTEPVNKIRYPNAALQISVSEARANYWRRNDERAKQEGVYNMIIENKK